MDVKEIPFKGYHQTANAEDLSKYMGHGWSAPIKLPAAVRFNGQLCRYINISEYGAIRLSEGQSGVYHYLPQDNHLPTDLGSFKGACTIVPWGEDLKMRGCGTVLTLDLVGGSVVINYKVKNRINSRQIYMFRVEFPLGRPNTVRVYYYHVVSGFNTYVGVELSPENFIEWPLKTEQPYMKKALEFLCVGAPAVDKPDNGPLYGITPTVPEPDDTTPFSGSIIEPKPKAIFIPEGWYKVKAVD